MKQVARTASATAAAPDQAPKIERDVGLDA
jgi:hypothetical protein